MRAAKRSGAARRDEDTRRQADEPFQGQAFTHGSHVTTPPHSEPG